MCSTAARGSASVLKRFWRVNRLLCKYFKATALHQAWTRVSAAVMLDVKLHRESGSTAGRRVA